MQGRKICSLCQKGTFEHQRRVKRQQELDDFNDEVAGRDNGKMRKAGADGGSARPHNDILDVMDAMELAAMVWNETFDRITHQLDVLDEANRLALQEADDDLRRIEEEATTLPDGRRVYLSRDGKHAYYEDGTLMSEEDKAAVQWRPNAADWETRQEAIRQREEIERYQQRIEAARQRLQGAKPGTMSQEELEKIEEDLQRDVPDSVRRKRDKMLADEPEPPSHAARQARMDVDVSASDRNAIQVVNTPKLSILTPA
ncbi:hypothetical protein [Niveispirillum sp.]|uniref:hypothetical protein n=1 Tax=Niveispirillum sp. TaxID=1917217 RepID=UPI001B7B38BB|nr:hypothetical protein [Niveispirillum sp.]MBP7339537.1 hypothetical protein [Niveispirillum sp.]